MQSNSFYSKYDATNIQGKSDKCNVNKRAVWDTQQDWIDVHRFKSIFNILVSSHLWYDRTFSNVF